MTSFLLDANLSPQTAEYLARTFAFDVTDLMTQHLGTLSDDDVVSVATTQRRVLITFDLDFGRIFRFREQPDFGVIILRLEDQTVESVNQALSRFFRDDAPSIPLETSLVLVDETRVRVVRTR